MVLYSSHRCPLLCGVRGERLNILFPSSWARGKVTRDFLGMDRDRFICDKLDIVLEQNLSPHRTSVCISPIYVRTP